MLHYNTHDAAIAVDWPSLILILNIKFKPSGILNMILKELVHCR